MSSFVLASLIKWSTESLGSWSELNRNTVNPLVSTKRTFQEKLPFQATLSTLNISRCKQGMMYHNFNHHSTLLYAFQTLFNTLNPTPTCLKRTRRLLNSTYLIQHLVKETAGLENEIKESTTTTSHHARPAGTEKTRVFRVLRAPRGDLR